MKALINVGNQEYPKILEADILFKDNIKGGVNNYIVQFTSSKNNLITSVHKNQITNYEELKKYYEEQKRLCMDAGTGCNT